MGDDFIPLNQSTPMTKFHRKGNRNRPSLGRSFDKSYSTNRFNNSRPHRGGQNNRGGNNSSMRDSSFANESNNSSQGHERKEIDAYLHPTMLEDPWARLREQMNAEEPT